MHLADIIRLRPLRCAGLLLTLTARCPLRCAHCSSSSTMDSGGPEPGQLLRFVGSFGHQDRPEVIMMTGGEPLLLPELVVELAATARRVGTRSAVLTGAYFARQEPLPEPVLRAARAVDHFSVSIDAYHERQVPRGHVFRLLRVIRDAGTAVSVHATGSGPHDPYLTDLLAGVRRVFGDEVPMLVNTLRGVGRAAAWASARPVAVDPGRVLPCAMAAWPVVTQDGTVVACCHQSTVDERPAPAHLRLGHIASDGWPAVREQTLASPVLRLIRTTGPAYLRARFGDPDLRPDGYCAGCRRLSDAPAVVAAAGRIAGGPAGELLDREAARLQHDAGPVQLVARYGDARYADLVALGSR